MMYKPALTRFLIWFLIACMAIPSIGITLPGTTGSTPDSTVVTVTYTFHPPIISRKIIRNETYCVLTTPTATLAGDPGEPDIPVYSARILLPYQQEPRSVSVRAGRSSILGTFNILPVAQASPLSGEEIAASDVPEKDQTIYSTDADFPGDLFTSIGTYCFRGYTILVLTLHPIQYNPRTQRTILYENLQITVTTTSSSSTDTLYRRGMDKDEVEEMIDNPDILMTYPITTEVPHQQYDLLILTTDALKNNFIPLAETHNASGVPSIIKTLSDVGGNTTDAIREYIKEAYTTWGIDYVLLGGDDDVVPAQDLYAEVNNGKTKDSFPSDLFYACLDGPFNFDGDAKWGEPHDGTAGGDVDLIADVYVGRTCVSSASEVDNFVAKTIAYLNNDPSEPNLDTLLMAGEQLDATTWGDDSMENLVQTAIPSDTYVIDKLYERDGPWEKSELITEINTGVRLINHLGHANDDYVMKLSNSDVDQLANKELFFVYTQGCYAGAFDIGDCIAEHFTVKTRYAAVAGVFNARYGWYEPGTTNGLSQMLHRSFLSDLLTDIQGTIGKANHHSKEYYLALINQNGMRWCYYETNLFGDPTLVFSLSHATASKLDCDGTITLSDVAPGAMMKARFAIKNAGEPLSTLYWKITEYPSWGTWTFSPARGEQLTPEQGAVTINVSVIAPSEKRTVFTGEIKVVNLQNYSDFCVISVSLTTSAGQGMSHPLIRLLVEKLLQRFPLLERFFNSHPVFASFCDVM